MRPIMKDTFRTLPISLTSGFARISSLRAFRHSFTRGTSRMGLRVILFSAGRALCSIFMLCSIALLPHCVSSFLVAFSPDTNCSFPAILVTIVYWVLLSSSSTFATPFSSTSPYLPFSPPLNLIDSRLVKYLKARFELCVCHIRTPWHECGTLPMDRPCRRHRHSVRISRGCIHHPRHTRNLQ